MPYSVSVQKMTGWKLIVELLDYLAVAKFEGADASGFLQAQLSADIDALEPGGAGFACYCSPKGQVFGLLLVCRLDNGFRVVAARELLPSMLDRLRMFVFRSKVEFALEEDSAVYGLSHPEPGPAEGALFPAGPDVGYLVTDSAVTTKPAGDFRALEIRNHIAWLDENTTEKFIPQMLGFEQIGAVSFTKGCYPGQEIVARARYLGKVKRGPLILAAKIDREISGGARLELKREEEWVKGAVVDCARDTAGMTYLFIIAPSDPGAQTTEFRYEGQDYRCATT
jgi:folate-binding protein YgfZ